jgi:hypothetical protein
MQLNHTIAKFISVLVSVTIGALLCEVGSGDSHTFGNTATMNDSWPSVVARVTGREVYNLGLGGYGPNQ